jgi:Transposase
MKTDKKLWRNRKARKELARRLQSENPGLEVVHPHAAGIDVGNGAHYVAVRPDCDAQPVRRLECFTADLYRLADWLQSCGVKSVALQSTAVYWIPLYDILEERGFEVYLVNARHTKNLPGRKNDVQESQWLLKLHTYGLLNNSFQPTFKDSGPAHLPTAAATTRHGSGDLCATNAKSADADEHSGRECDQRPEWGDWTADCAGHRGRRTRLVEARGTQSSADSSQPCRDCQKPGGQLAPGADLCVATGNRNV